MSDQDEYTDEEELAAKDLESKLEWWIAKDEKLRDESDLNFGNSHMIAHMLCDMMLCFSDHLISGSNEELAQGIHDHLMKAFSLGHNVADYKHKYDIRKKAN